MSYRCAKGFTPKTDKLITLFIRGIGHDFEEADVVEAFTEIDSELKIQKATRPANWRA